MVEQPPGIVLSDKPPRRPESNVDRLTRRLALASLATDEEMPIGATLAREIVKGDADLSLALEKPGIALGDRRPPSADAADGIGNATRARRLSAVRTFFRFLARRLGVENPALALIATPRAKRPVPRA